MLLLMISLRSSMTLLGLTIILWFVLGESTGYDAKSWMDESNTFLNWRFYSSQAYSSLEGPVSISADSTGGEPTFGSLEGPVSISTDSTGGEPTFLGLRGFNLFCDYTLTFLTGRKSCKTSLRYSGILLASLASKVSISLGEEPTW